MITRRHHYAVIVAVVSMLVLGAGAWAFATSSLRPHHAPVVVTTSAAVTPGVQTSIVECVPDNLVQEPDALTLACADANDYLMHLTWRDWGQNQATAEGILVSNNCEPSCVRGLDESTSVIVVAGGLARQGAAARYTTLTVNPEGPGPVRVYQLPGFDDPQFG